MLKLQWKSQTFQFSMECLFLSIQTSLRINLNVGEHIRLKVTNESLKRQAVSEGLCVSLSDSGSLSPSVCVCVCLCVCWSEIAWSISEVTDRFFHNITAACDDHLKTATTSQRVTYYKQTSLRTIPSCIAPVFTVDLTLIAPFIRPARISDTPHTKSIP